MDFPGELGKEVRGSGGDGVGVGVGGGSKVGGVRQGVGSGAMPEGEGPEEVRKPQTRFVNIFIVFATRNTFLPLSLYRPLSPNHSLLVSFSSVPLFS
jgi:hypothetical protein